MISDLFIPATNKSPEICLSANGKITISGRCIPYEPDDFFAPVMEWASSYCLEPAEETVIDLSIEYINCTNSGKLYRFLKKLKEGTLPGKKLVINFIYETDDDFMEDYGHDLSERLALPVTMNPVEKLTAPVTVKAPPYKSIEPPSE